MHDSPALTLLPDVRGDAQFQGAHAEYRLLIERDWSPPWPLGARQYQSPDYVLWIGRNPGPAGPTSDDQITRKQQRITRSLQVTRMLCCNVTAYRVRSPQQVNDPQLPWQHPDNLILVQALARNARFVIAATGYPPPPLMLPAQTLFGLLKRLAIPTYCMGLVQDGWPRHLDDLPVGDNSKIALWSGRMRPADAPVARMPPPACP